MATLTESVLVETTLKEAWDFYFDRQCWRSWVDGFDKVESAEAYPEAGGTLIWRSTPAGRGSVEERVLEHEPRTRHRIAFTDPQSEGELETHFAVEGDAVRVTLRLDYALTVGGPLGWLTDRFFVRGQLRRSLARTLARFEHEVEEVSSQP